jgi:hypothetical protein
MSFGIIQSFRLAPPSGGPFALKWVRYVHMYKAYIRIGCEISKQCYISLIILCANALVICDDTFQRSAISCLHPISNADLPNSSWSLDGITFTQPGEGMSDKTLLDLWIDEYLTGARHSGVLLQNQKRCSYPKSITISPWEAALCKVVVATILWMNQ